MTNITRERDGWLLVERPVEGATRRVLLLPGLMGCDVVFTPLLAEPALAAAGIHAMAGNPPGFKGLPVVRDFEFTIESYAALVETLAAAEGIGVIVGHSYFANVLIEVAARGTYGGKLVLISPSLSRAAEAKDLRDLDRFSRSRVLRAPIWWLTYLMMKSVFRPYFSDPVLLDEITAGGKLIPPNVARRTLVGFFDHLDRHGDLAARLATTRVPVRYLRGDEDDIGFTDLHRATLALSPLIEVHEIRGARHFAMCDQPAALAEHLVAMAR
jgi:pimeloyl-ACP methyl ester carboxylesterase